MPPLPPSLPLRPDSGPPFRRPPDPAAPGHARQPDLPPQDATVNRTCRPRPRPSTGPRRHKLPIPAPAFPIL